MTMKLIRRFRSWWRGHQSNAVQGGLERLGCINTASQMSGNNYLGPNATIWQRNHGVGDQFKNNYTSLESLCGNALKKNEWSSTVAGDLNRLGGGGHQSILLIIRDGEAYDLSGQKWSRCA